MLKRDVIRKSVIVSIIGLAAMLGTIATASAQTTGSITLTGTVSQILQITVTPAPGYDTLDLTTSQTDLLVATVTEKSNNQAGYTVTVESQNAAALGSSTAFFKGSDAGNGDTLNYGMSYNGAAVSLDASGAAVVSDVAGTTAQTGVDKQLAITYTGAFLNADTYSDTLTFTIAAK